MVWFRLKQSLKELDIRLPLGTVENVDELCTRSAYSELIRSDAARSVVQQLWGFNYSRTIGSRRVSFEVFPYSDRLPDGSEVGAMAVAKDYIPCPVSVVGQCTALFEGTIYDIPHRGTVEIPLFILVDSEGTWYLQNDTAVHFFACSIDDALTALLLYPSAEKKPLVPLLIAADSGSSDW
jgi:hypothetical protein